MDLPVWPFQGFRSRVSAILWMMFFPAWVLAQETVTSSSVSANQAAPQAARVAGGTHGFQTLPPGAGAMQTLGYIVAILLFLCAGMILFYRGNVLGGWRSGARGARKLQVEETRALGQRQFLAVVDYEGRKMLLGVCPGRIDYLCPLDGGEGDKVDFRQLIPAPEDAAANPKPEKDPGQ